MLRPEVLLCSPGVGEREAEGDRGETSGETDNGGGQRQTDRQTEVCREKGRDGENRPHRRGEGSAPSRSRAWLSSLRGTPVLALGPRAGRSLLSPLWQLVKAWVVDGSPPLPSANTRYLSWTKRCGRCWGRKRTLCPHPLCMWPSLCPAASDRFRLIIAHSAPGPVTSAFVYSFTRSFIHSSDSSGNPMRQVLLFGLDTSIEAQQGQVTCLRTHSL